MSENVSRPESTDTGKTTSLVPVRPAATPARTAGSIRAAIRRAERDARRAGAPKIRPVRAIGTVAAVGALIAGVAFPAYAAIQSEGESMTMHDVAAGSAQSLVVASEVESPEVTGSSYAATTPDEIAQKEAERAAAERAKEAAAAAAAAARNAASVASVPQNIPAPPASSGSIGLPLPGGYSLGDSLGAGHSQATHDGLDMLIGSGTPIYAIADGVISSAGYSGGYGLMVRYNSSVDGQAIEVRNAHMSGAAVSPGQTVTKGQVIGYVGSTGASSAPHLHIEIRVNGGLVDPLYWLPL
ncbi:M23 family metallopeptidase [Microbacterium rhizophilus]|uniref:M23 family metallopeptidase n=1 Tax=Microbacterium rhizophilus TaxID=3138934 RepID=UPI0031E90F3A